MVWETLLGPERADDDDYDDDDDDSGGGGDDVETLHTTKRRRFSMITGENNIADNVHAAVVV